MGCFYSKAAQGELSKQIPLHLESVASPVIDSKTSLQNLDDPIKSR